MKVLRDQGKVTESQQNTWKLEGESVILFSFVGNLRKWPIVEIHLLCCVGEKYNQKHNPWSSMQTQKNVPCRLLSEKWPKVKILISCESRSCAQATDFGLVQVADEPSRSEQ